MKSINDEVKEQLTRKAIKAWNSNRLEALDVVQSYPTLKGLVFHNEDGKYTNLEEVLKLEDVYGATGYQAAKDDFIKHYVDDHQFLIVRKVLKEIE